MIVNRPTQSYVVMISIIAGLCTMDWTVVPEL